jgi:hypothetical protein
VKDPSSVYRSTIRSKPELGSLASKCIAGSEAGRGGGASRSVLIEESAGTMICDHCRLELAPEDRAAWLAGSCEGDQLVESRAQRLLAAHDPADRTPVIIPDNQTDSPELEPETKRNKRQEAYPAVVSAFYGEIERMARARMRHERRAHTLHWLYERMTNQPGSMLLHAGPSPCWMIW